MRRSRRLALAVGVLAVAAAAPASAALDGSAPMPPDFPSFLRVSVGERLITDARPAGCKTEITSASRLDGRLLLPGGENGRGWSAAIAEDTGRLSAGVVADKFTFALFGACTTP